MSGLVLLILFQAKLWSLRRGGGCMMSAIFMVDNGHYCQFVDDQWVIQLTSALAKSISEGASHQLVFALQEPSV